MVAAQNGSMTFLGQSNRVYNLSIYISDVAAAKVTFSLDGAAVAGSDTRWILPETATLVDASIVTGLTVTTLKALVNNTPIGQVLFIPNHINTLATRVSPRITIGGGKELSFVQG